MEPIVAPLPRENAIMTPEVAAFVDATTKQREENAYLRGEVDQLTRDVRLAHERVRMLESELTEVRADRDFLQRHDAEIMNGLEVIETVIIAQKAKARASAYAPPGTGQQTEPGMTDEEIERVEALARTLKPVTIPDA